MNTRTYDPHGVEPSLVAKNIGQFEYSISEDHAKSKAESLSLNIVKPDDYTLQLDFDTEEQWEKFMHQRLTILLEYTKVDRVWWTESFSGNKHVYVKLREPMDFLKRIAYQAALGSDPTRELLSLARVEVGGGYTTMMFEKPGAAEVVIYSTDGYQSQLTDGAVASNDDFIDHGVAY